ncbi:hypothetical protein NPX13_g8860 [Xylaria arbuscula]|uniref:Uncharacterized protein n=1 Tax=Xylaria arbuscula TaxID=114810 RepID=A0A9W8N7T1_9PEZI|nr:hypothetical protein NPX13_g8860 [Xylaria arbuscula]
MACKINTSSTLEGMYSDLITEEPTIQSWLNFLEYLSSPPAQREKSSRSSLEISEPRLKRLFDTTNLEDLKTLSILASRPSTLDGAGKFLVHAAETTDEDLLDRICMEPFSPDQTEAVSRALAASHGTAHNTLMNKAASILDEQAINKMQLAALVLGNTAVSEKLISNLPSLRKEIKYGFVAEVLIAGLEYGDEEIIEDICNSCSDALRRHNTSLARLRVDDGDHSVNWSIFHAAAQYGSQKATLYILGSELLRDVSGFQASRSPLFIAAAQGFPRIVDHILSAGALVDSLNGDKELSALHIASLLGHWETTVILINGGADPTISDANGDFPLHLAIRQGHSRVAEFLVQKFSPVSELHNEVNNDTSVFTLEHTVSREQASPEGGIIFDPIYNFLNYANADGVTVLAEAAEKELVDVCKLILQQGGDPNIQDDTGKVALHLAAMRGSADMVKDLVVKGSTTDHVAPMHYACYRGALDVVELLLSLTDLKIEDSWNRTPISAAAYAGHLGTVKLLYESYDDRGRAQALCAAASQFHRDVVEYLLKSGCPVDGINSNSVPLDSIDLYSHGAKFGLRPLR